MTIWATYILAVFSLISGFASIGHAGTDDEFRLQEQCSKLAVKYFFTDYGTGIYNNDYVDPDTHETLYDETRYAFVSHYNTKTQKCFTVITDTNITRFGKIENLAIWMMIIDLSRRRVIGMFHQFNGGAHADVCFIGSQDCHSRNEWEFLLGSYMKD